MAVKKYKPTTPGQRGMTSYTFEEITRAKPERSLTGPLRRHGGRNAYGRVTVGISGGTASNAHSRLRRRSSIPGRGQSSTPNRTAFAAAHADGESATSAWLTSR
jgi:large subunit ribosomal protein L2